MNGMIAHSVKCTRSNYNCFNAEISIQKSNKTSMMWPSQNFLLYNGTVLKIQVNENG